MPHATFAALPPVDGALVVARFAPTTAAGAPTTPDAEGIVAMTAPAGRDGEPLLLSGGGWSCATHLAIDAFVDGDRIGSLRIGFHVAGETEPRLTVSLGVLPGMPTRLSFPLAHLDGQTIYPTRTPGRLKAFCLGRRVAASEIAYASITAVDTSATRAWRLRGICLTSAEPDHPVPAAPQVDALGQRLAGTWPGKTRDQDELVAALRTELAAAEGEGFPTGWSRFGGDAGRRRDATGFFRAERIGGRWWLIDPEGCPWFSAGLDCVNPTQDTTLLPGMAALCAWTPGEDPAFAAASGVSPRGRARCDFMVANLIRAFGADWHEAWIRLTAARLRRWRFTTIANWSDIPAARAMRLPYVLPMPVFPSTGRTLFRDLPDVFAPEFAANAATWARFLEPYRDDPFLVGYFLANEPHWGFGRFNLASEMLEANPGTHSRRVLAGWLAERYATPEALSAAWGVAIAGFAELETGLFVRLADRSPTAAADLWEFSRRLAAENLRVVSAATRAVAPHHLNLGLRYAWISSDLCYEGAQHCDVFTINCYQHEPEAAMIDEAAERTGKPVMIGEWHFGALDRGLPATGLVAVPDQAQRGIGYQRYLEWCAAHPAVVGAHWFTLGDQSYLGRFDGENFQIGFVDVCHRPYPEMVAGATAAHERMYAVRRGEVPMTAQRVAQTPRVGF